MDEIISERIKNLIEELKVYDRDFSSYFIEDGKQIKPDPREPREAMKRLVEIGEPAVEPLLELLEGIETWSILYAIEVLGEIGDVRAVLPLLNLQHEHVIDESLDALQKIGLPTLEPVLEYLRSSWEEIGGKIWAAFHILSKIKDDRSYKVLFKGLSHPDPEVREYAAMYLGDYGDKRAFRGVVEVFKEDPENSEVQESVRVLAKDPLAYREVLVACGVVGRERIEEVRKNIDESIREISYAYRERFKGDDAEKFNTVARLYKIREAIVDILREVSELAVDEGAISNNTYEKLESISSKIFRRNFFKFHSMYKDILDASEYKFRGPSISESNRSYRGLTKGSWLDPQPRLDALGERIKSWLKGSSFKVHKIGSCLWARKKRAKKECLIVLKKMERKRIYGEVTIEIIGEGWIEDEAEIFNISFWKNVEKAVKEIVGDADR